MENKVLFCIDKYFNLAGASVALANIIKYNHTLDNPIVFCKRDRSKGGTSDINIIVGTGKDVVDKFVSEKYEVIHFLRSNGYTIFKEIITECRKRKIQIPIITTICQKPSYKGLQLSQFEIENSDKIIFIDKTAYNDKLYAFIPEAKRGFNYFGDSEEDFNKNVEIGKLYKPHDDCIVIGRGSSLNKCPKDMFEVFDMIDKPKKFVIVGSGDDPTWIIKGIEARKNDYEIEYIPELPYEHWLKKLSEFDIFLYHLPKDGYSSIDGTLGSAMIMGKPCVYMGPDAPAERFYHGENGYIAHTKQELAEYCNLLMHDAELRKRIGVRAVETTKRDFPLSKTIANYNRWYDELAQGKLNKGGISFGFRLYWSKLILRHRVTSMINLVLRLTGLSNYQLSHEF